MVNRGRGVRVLVPALLVGTAAVLMLGNLGTPARIIFDEVYYVNDARDILEFGIEQGFVVHPPLGKMLIAFSIWLFGDNPFGWRVLGALAGVATVLLTYLIGLRLFKRMAPAALAALLVALDGIFIVQARTTMLDIHLAFFTALGAWALIAHVQRTREADEAWLAADPGPHDRLPRRDITLLLVAGVAFGLAIGTKWSGLLGLGGAGLVMIGTELARRRRVLGSMWRQLVRGVALITASLVVIPFAVYVATWAPWFLEFPQTYEGRQVCDEPDDCAVTLPGRASALVDFHGRVTRFHSNLEAKHGYRAPATTWAVQARPVVYYYETCSENRLNRVPTTDDDGNEEIPDPCIVERGQAAEMLSLGNLALWWGFLPATILLVGGMVRGDRRAAIPLTFVAAQFLPWLVVSRPVFSFYAVPMVPFVALGLAAVIARFGDRRPWGATAIGGLIGGVVGAGLVWVATLVAIQADIATYGLTAAAGAVVGAALAAWGHPPADDTPDSILGRQPGWSPTATWLTVLVTMLAVGLAIYFLPLWTGIPINSDALRARWWFHGWV